MTKMRKSGRSLESLSDAPPNQGDGPSGRGGAAGRGPPRRPLPVAGVRKGVGGLQQVGACMAPSALPSGPVYPLGGRVGPGRASAAVRGEGRRREDMGESATNVFCAILYVLRGHPAGRGRRGGKRARVRHLRRRRRRGGRTAARTREASAGGGEPLALPPADREEGRVGQGLRVGKPATAASRTSGNRGRRAMAIGGESCGARRRCIGYGV